MLFQPESPRWLVEHGHRERAADSLARAIPDATVLSPAHEAAIRALAEYAGPRILSFKANPWCRNIKAVCVELEAITCQPPILRFLRAKRQSAHLGRLSKKLEQAQNSFMVRIISCKLIYANVTDIFPLP